MILGVLLFLAPPLILLIIYGNLNITGFGYTLSFFSIPVTLIGIVIFVKGLLMAKPKSPDVIIDKLHLDNPVINNFIKSTETHNSWIWTLIFALFTLINIPFVWRDNSYPALAKSMFLFFIIVSLLILVIVKYTRKIPWVVLLIGNAGLVGRDERETAILRKAAQYTLAVIVGLLIGLFALLLFLPFPSSLALMNIILTFLSLIPGVYGFSAWKLGLK